MSFFVGQEFYSYEDLHNKLNEYEIASSTKLSRRDSRFMKDKSPFRHELRYCYLHYICAFYKRRCLKKSEDCSFALKLSTSRIGDCLVVSEFNDQHNHEVSQSAFKANLQQRKLTPEEEYEVIFMMAVEPNLREVLKKCTTKTNKSVTLRDLQCLRSRLPTIDIPQDLKFKWTFTLMKRVAQTVASMDTTKFLRMYETLDCLADMLGQGQIVKLTSSTVFENEDSQPDYRSVPKDTALSSELEESFHSHPSVSHSLESEQNEQRLPPMNPHMVVQPVPVLYAADPTADYGQVSASYITDAVNDFF